MARLPLSPSWRALGALLITCVGAAAAADGQKPPPAPSQPVTDVLNGVSVPDPYRNLEQLAAPATREWLNAQADHATQVLGRIPGRDAMAQRLQELSRASGDAVSACCACPASGSTTSSARSARASSS